MTRISLVLLLALQISPAPQAAAPPTDPAQAVQMVGGDRDEHGCIGSAGYVWCPRAAECVRPWELAAEKGFESGEEAFTQYCSDRGQ
jgi:hypothetical protein